MNIKPPITITCISDLHGYQPELPGGELLIIAGDLTANDTVEQYTDFYDWCFEQDYEKVVYICGNHDKTAESDYLNAGKIIYLNDSGTEFKGLKIWGSPWSSWFQGINPQCTAFTKKTDEELKEKWDLIPEDTDILITHSPPYGIFDESSNIKRVGSGSLRRKIDRSNIKLHVFGHIHEGYGIKREGATVFVNASHVNENYEPLNEPRQVGFYTPVSWC